MEEIKCFICGCIKEEKETEPRKPESKILPEKLTSPDIHLIRFCESYKPEENVVNGESLFKFSCHVCGEYEIRLRFPCRNCSKLLELIENIGEDCSKELEKEIDKTNGFKSNNIPEELLRNQQQRIKEFKNNMLKLKDCVKKHKNSSNSIAHLCKEILDTFHVNNYECNISDIIYKLIKDAGETNNKNEFKEKIALLKRYVKKHADSGGSEVLIITPELCKRIFDDTEYPGPIKQVNYLIEFLGNTLKHPGRYYNNNGFHVHNNDFEEKIKRKSKMAIESKKMGTPIEYPHSLSELISNLISVTASLDEENLQQICEYAKELELIKVPELPPSEKYTDKESFLKPFLKQKNQYQCSDEFNMDLYKDYGLTLKGWQKYEEIKDGIPDSKTVFMAMAFCNKTLQKFYKTHIKKAVKATGYTLEKVDENPQKDEFINIDIMLKIRSSKFIIADLSDANNGAYWEAGYAKGLNKKVIYIFDSSKWNKKDKKCEKCGKQLNPRPHFDVNHNRIICWDNNNPKEFVEKLKKTIRYLFPESKQKDN